MRTRPRYVPRPKVMYLTLAPPWCSAYHASAQLLARAQLQRQTWRIRQVTAWLGDAKCVSAAANCRLSLHHATPPCDADHGRDGAGIHGHHPRDAPTHGRTRVGNGDVSTTEVGTLPPSHRPGAHHHGRQLLSDAVIAAPRGVLIEHRRIRCRMPKAGLQFRYRRTLLRRHHSARVT